MEALISVEQLWGKALAEGRTSHAYLLAGEGAEFAAREFLLQLICRDSLQKPCRACAPCRKLLHGSHPDVRWVESEAGGTRIGIDQVREIHKDARFPPLEASYKAYVLSDAERLTPEAANGLLKILEDPPPYVIFLLLSRGLRLLPTILSRCQIVRLRPFSAEELAKALAQKGYSPAEVKYGVALASGIPARSVRLLVEPSPLGPQPLKRREELLASLALLSPPELAERFAQSEDLVEEHEAAVELFVRLTSGKLKAHEVLELAPVLAKLPAEKAELFFWEALRGMRALLFLVARVPVSPPEGVSEEGRRQQAQAIAPQWQADSLRKAIKKLEKGMSALQANANAQLLWESLLLVLTPLRYAGA